MKANKHLVKGHPLLFQVHIQGLTGRIKLSHGKRMDFSLDIMELRDDGLRKVCSVFDPRYQKFVMEVTPYQFEYRVFEHNTKTYHLSL